MPEISQHARVIRFGVFEADPQAGELRKSGLKIKLQEQPFQILVLLLEHPGHVITREEIRQTLWPADTFVDFDHSLNSAVKKLRQALGDDSGNPRFIETLPRRGYRLIVPVTGGSSSASELTSGISSSQPETKRLPSSYWLGALGAAALVVAALILWKTVLSVPGDPKVLRFSQLTNDGAAKAGALATDGLRVYFNEILPGPRLVIVQVPLQGGEAVPLSVPLRFPRLMDLSKEGTELLIANDDGDAHSSLWVQPVTGGSPRRVGGDVSFEDARFAADSASIIYGKGHEVYTVSLDGSSRRRLLTADNFPYSFRFSPDSRVLRFSLVEEQREAIAIMEAAADGTGLHQLFQGCCGKWTADGRYFIFENKIDNRVDLWALPETRRFRWRNRPVRPIQLTAGPLNFLVPLPAKDGKQVFAIGDSPRCEVIRYDSRTSQFVPYFSGISAEGLAFSRDEQWVAYTSYPEGMLWRSKGDGSERLQLTFPPLRAFLPRWSPDGKQIAFSALAPGGVWNVYLVSSQGGVPEPVFPSPQSQMDPNWSPDGNSLVFGTLSVADMPIYTVDLNSKHVTRLPGSTGFFSPRWSPDGRYIAAIRTEHPGKLMLFDFATQKWTEEFEFEIGYLSWSRDGKYIYFQHRHNPGPGAPEYIARLRISDRKLENLVEVRKAGRLTTGTITDWFGLSPDDSPLLARDIGTQEIYAIDVQWP